MAKHICVEYAEVCTYSEREPVQYGSWEECYDSNITEVYTIDADEHGPYCSEVFTVPDDATEVYVVYMIYDTGDSFGRAYGKIDLIHCTASEEAADALAKKITENSEEFLIEYVDDFGREISIHNNGAGYFQHIRYVGVEKFAVDGKSKRRYYVN